MSSVGCDDFIPTKSSQRRQKPPNFEVVVYKNNYKGGQKRPRSSKKTENEAQSVDMKKARFEVYKFSKSDLNFSNRQESNVELAIKLGAKPPRNKGVNYKILKAERELKSKDDQETGLLKQLTNNFKDKMGNKKDSKTTNTVKHKAKAKGILDIYGKVKPTKPVKAIKAKRKS